MIWLPLIALALLAFVLAAFVVKLPRSGWALFGAALLFGLTGYALQGSPGMAGSPSTPTPEANAGNMALVEARRQMFDPGRPASRFVTVADGFARRGQFEDAAGILSGAVSQNSNDGEAWLALANALVEHADGTLTPAALYAYGQAQAVLPNHPGPSYFLGVALIRSGRPLEARQLWAQTLEQAPADAPWRGQMEERLARLDELLMQAVRE
ncbi:cytochrome c biogenesis factor [Allopontixanthobacter sp.]|uniref:tetratricopeptide repeat protein n=1 Tax=Allopontixanthobacter sp. TaxID=2906452 RepID=UPI002ABA8BCA|nr:cytochrome c biogenesis factor [Allopontixanthobacter sp.]MDZ4308160.1 cytochrome c biogenesis factor [Allopontixanthobacter sp.]